MALPSSVFSFASRLLSLRPYHVTRMIHVGKVNPLAEEATSRNEPLQDNDDASNEEQFIQDITVDDTLLEKDFFGVQNLFTTELLFKRRVHYGHKQTSLDPTMRQFVYGFRSNQVIFDLDITAYHLREALNFTAHIALRGGVILFVARLPQAAHVIEKTAKLSGEFAHTRQWMDGTLLDINRYQGLECRLPDLIILPSTLSEFGTQHLAVSDAAKLNIPTVAIVDSNCNPNLVTYPIPGNDDSPSSISLYCSLFSKAIALGKKERSRRLALVLEEIASEQSLKKTKLNWKTTK